MGHRMGARRGASLTAMDMMEPNLIATLKTRGQHFMMPCRPHKGPSPPSTTFLPFALLLHKGWTLHFCLSVCRRAGKHVHASHNTTATLCHRI